MCSILFKWLDWLHAEYKRISLIHGVKSWPHSFCHGLQWSQSYSLCLQFDLWPRSSVKGSVGHFNMLRFLKIQPLILWCLNESWAFRKSGPYSPKNSIWKWMIFYIRFHAALNFKLFGNPLKNVRIKSVKSNEAQYPASRSIHMRMTLISQYT